MGKILSTEEADKKGGLERDLLASCNVTFNFPDFAFIDPDYDIYFDSDDLPSLLPLPKTVMSSRLQNGDRVAMIMGNNLVVNVFSLNNSHLPGLYVENFCDLITNGFFVHVDPGTSPEVIWSYTGNVRMWLLDKIDVLILDSTNDSSSLPLASEYFLAVESDSRDKVSVSLTVFDSDGLYAGISTLLQLINFEPMLKIESSKLHVSNTFNMPLLVHDWADYGLRGTFLCSIVFYQYSGFMLDLARHYIPISLIKRTIHGMFLSKLNTLHLHLTDAQVC